MANDLHTNLASYFSCLEKYRKNWNSMCDKLNSLINELRNQTEYLYAVTSYEVDNLEIFEIDGVRNALISKIIIAASESREMIKQELLQLHKDIQELGNKLNNLETSRSKISLHDPSVANIVNGTSRRPALNTLLEYAIYSHMYYNNLYINSKECLMKMNCNDKDSIELLAQSFVPDKLQEERLTEILLNTQFLIKDIPL